MLFTLIENVYIVSIQNYTIIESMLLYTCMFAIFTDHIQQ